MIFKFMLVLERIAQCYCKAKTPPPNLLAKDPQACTIITVFVHLPIQFACHIFFLAPDTDYSTFTTGRAHYSQLILRITIIACVLIYASFTNIFVLRVVAQDY